MSRCHAAAHADTVIHIVAVVFIVLRQHFRAGQGNDRIMARTRGFGRALRSFLSGFGFTHNRIAD